MNSNNHFISGIITGLIFGLLSSFVFNPIDKIIFIITTKNCKISDKNLWKGLYDGLFITITSRFMTSGLYYAFLDYYSGIGMSNLETSIITSIACSIINPLHLIKFNSWYNCRSCSASYNLIIKTYGYKGLAIGIIPLITRDILYNYIYLSINRDDDTTLHLIAILSSLIIASPINLIKNKKYASNESLRTIIKNFDTSQLGISASIIRMVLWVYFNKIIYNYIKYLL